jgi:phosphoadenosine phosphosulfate reductase
MSTKITMVKKELLGGEPCRKCAQAQATLEARGLWERIDEVVIAKEGEPESPGMRLGARHGVDLAPFFIIQTDGQEPQVYTSVIKFIKALPAEAAAKAAAGDAPSRTDDSSESTAGLAERLDRKAPRDILRNALERFGEDCGIAFSGAEDVVLIDMASRMGLPFSVFSLDTGRMHPETLKFIDEVRSHYGIEIAVYSPDSRALEPFVRKKGLFSFYEDGHHECCGIRKVEPLRRALTPFDAWVTGQRKDQSVTRVQLAVVAEDDAHEGRSGTLLKYNPLTHWSSARVWEYIRDNEVPYNQLHERGFISIGCEPCTRAIRPGEHERAGRWWWELETQRECGLHRPE